MVLQLFPKKYKAKKGQFGFSRPNYEKELARVSSNTKKIKTAKQKASLKGAKMFYTKKIEAKSGKSRKKRRKSRGKSRRRK